MRPSEPGKTKLLDAGRAVLGGGGLAALSVNAVVAEAGMAKGSFYQHWATRRDFLVELHRRFHDQLFSEVAARTADQFPGLDRLRTGMTVFLDGCLSERSTKGLLVQARTEAALDNEVAKRNAEGATLALPDLRALGWEPAEPIATLFVAAVAEIALQELAARRPQPDLRDALIRLVTRHP